MFFLYNTIGGKWCSNTSGKILLRTIKTQIIRRQKLSAWDKLADEVEFSHQPADKRAEDSAQQDDDTPPDNEGYESGKIIHRIVDIDYNGALQMEITATEDAKDPKNVYNHKHKRQGEKRWIIKARQKTHSVKPS